MKKAKHMNEQPLTVEQRKKRKARRNAIGWTVFLVLLALVIAALLLLPRLASREVEREQDIQSVQAAPARLASTIHAAGTLIDEEAVSVTVPSGMELEYAVKNGDFVEVGDLIATVDETSVMLTIAEIQSAMDTLDEKIADAMDGEEATVMTAPADGRVKKILAESGDSVAEVMYDSGALMLLSLDGKMAVDVDASLVSAGQSVDVTLSDGTVKSGRVATVTGSVATVTITDNGPDAGDIVTVSDGDGNYLGGGELYIHSELKVTGYYGRTEEIFVEEEEEVEIGDDLISFAETDSSAAYAALLAERQQLETQLKTLFQIYQRGGVYAAERGYVTEVGAAEEESNQNQNTMGGFGFMPMSHVEETVVSAVDLSQLEEALGHEDPALNSGEAPGGDDTTPGGDDTTPGGDDTTPGGDETTPGGDDTTPGGDDTTPGGDDTIPGEDDSDEPEGDDDTGDGDTTGDASDEPEGDASDEPSGEPVQSGLKDVYGYVESTADGTVVLRMSNTEDYIHYGDSAALQSLEYTESKSLFYTAGEDTTTVFFYTNGVWTMGNMSGISAGAYVVLTYTVSADGEQLMWIISHQQTASGGTDSDSSASDEMSTTTTTPNTGTMPNTGVTGMPGTTQQQSSALSEITICAITPDTDMTVEIPVDELDVLDVYEGQTVELYLPALEETVTGEITEIAEEATSNGGNAKFDAIITIRRTAGMRTGMNAAVTVLLEEGEAACCLPAEALVEMGSKTCVYTIWDEKNEELTGLVEVTCGASDGDMVEILSGLQPGDTVYYEYTETLSEIIL